MSQITLCDTVIEPSGSSPISMLEFCERFLYVNNCRFSLTGRPYLEALYRSQARRVVLRAGRQVEKTTFLVNTILYLAVQYPGIHIVVVFPRLDQALNFSNTRFLPTLENAPLLRRHLIGNTKRRLPVLNPRFRNGSQVFIRAAFNSGDAVRGIDGDVLLVDEFQDVAPWILPVLEQTLSHAEHPRVFLTGTPKSIDNHLEFCFRQSTANEFKIPCRGCRNTVLPDERCLDLTGPICPACQHPINVREGQWVPRNPTSAWGDGFWISQLMVPWLNYTDLLENQRTYDPAQFKNECVGLPTTLGDHIVTRAELEACCQNYAMGQTVAHVPEQYRNRLVAGIDWGGGTRSRTVLVVGYMDDSYRFVVVRMDRFTAQEDPNFILEEVSRTCNQFRVRAVAADGNGNGYVFNRMLYALLGASVDFYAIRYSATEQTPREDGALWQWTVGRSASIGNLFARVKRRAILFPRVEECGTFLDEIGCEIAEYDDHDRAIRYTHPESQPDDTLHALNYAWLLGTREHYGRQRAAESERTAPRVQVYQDLEEREPPDLGGLWGGR